VRFGRYFALSPLKDWQLVTGGQVSFAMLARVLSCATYSIDAGNSVLLPE
jgi:hypothetical protein